MVSQLAPPRVHADVRRLSLARWTAFCAIAEAIGMTAAATAAKVSQALVGEPGNGHEAAVVPSLVVCGGLVEGVALGGLQAAGLGRLIPGLNRRRWLLATTAVAGLGWAAASAPAALSGADDGSVPPLVLVLGGALAMGAVMGAVLGAVQAKGLSGHVRHPWRWVGANAAAWAPAMAVIFLGATAPGADWSGPTVAALGTVTGLAAGTVLGLVTGWFLPTLNGPPAHNSIVMFLLGSRAHGAVDRSLVALRVRGKVSGRTFELPVQYVATVDGLVVAPGRPESKRWWRNLTEPAAVDVLLHGSWHQGLGLLLRPGDPGYDAASAVYRQRWSRIALPEDNPLVRVRLDVDRSEQRLGHSPDDVDLPDRLAHVPVPAPSRARDERDTRTQFHRRAVLAGDRRVTAEHMHVLPKTVVLPSELARGDLPDAALHDVVAIQLQNGSPRIPADDSHGFIRLQRESQCITVADQGGRERRGHGASRLPISQWCPNGSATRPIRQP
jgi:hypothetical protein